MKYFAANYNCVLDRMERISPKFDTYTEAAAWIEANGPRNCDGDSIAMVSHDYYEATDYPVSDQVMNMVKVSSGIAEFERVCYDDSTIRTGDTVRDANNYQGVVIMSDDDDIVIMWSNGMRSSFARKYLDRNRICKFTQTGVDSSR